MGRSNVTIFKNGAANAEDENEYRYISISKMDDDENKCEQCKWMETSGQILRTKTADAGEGKEG